MQGRKFTSSLPVPLRTVRGYSFDLREPAQIAAPSAGQNGPDEEDQSPAVADALKSVGLELKPAKEQLEKLVIDRVEKPSEN